MPTWISWPGLLIHVAVGAVLAVVLSALGSPPAATVLAVAATGVAHELGDGDFQAQNHGPLNGLLDVAAFLVGTFVLLLIR
jgi:hypothetical protein